MHFHFERGISDVAIMFKDTTTRDSDPRNLHLKNLDHVQREAVDELAKLEANRLVAQGFHWSYLVRLSQVIREAAEDLLNRTGGAAKP